MLKKSVFGRKITCFIDEYKINPHFSTPQFITDLDRPMKNISITFKNTLQLIRNLFYVAKKVFLLM